MKILFKSTTLILATVFFVYLMNHYDWVDLSNFKTAFTEGRTWIVWACVSQTFLALGMLVRYHFILNLFGLHVPFVKTTQATFVGNGLGQWAPGSMAFIEAIRLVLMVGTCDKGTKSTLAAVSLYDRLIGFFCILLLGALAAGYLLLTSTSESSSTQLGILTLASFLGAIGIAATPFIAGSKLITTLFAKLLPSATAMDTVVQDLSKPRGLQHWLIKIAQKINAIRLEVAWKEKSPKGLFLPVGLSFASIFFAIYSIYFCSVALNLNLNLTLLASVYPIITVVGLLPLGIGGLGGQQLVIASLVAFVGLSPGDVASACLLQAGLILLQYTIFTFPFLPSTLTHIRKNFSLPSKVKQC